MESLSVELKLSAVKVGVQIPYITGIGPLLNARDCYAWVMQRKNLVGWTYSVSSYHLMAGKFKRLIAGRGEPRPNIKFANNVHIKCYIDKNEMLVTSFNLTSPTLEDLGVRITDRNQIRHMLRQFNKHWKEL